MLTEVFQQPDSFGSYQRISNALGIADYSSRIVHYTSLEKLEKILTSRSLWFGSTTQLNDTTECSHFLDHVLDNSHRLLGSVEIPFLEDIIQQLGPEIRNETFVSSWCEYFEAEKHGKLSMWRAYADTGRGVAVVVDSSQFLPSALTPQKTSFPVWSSKVDYVQSNRAVDLANDMIRRLSNLPDLQSSPSEMLTLAMALLAKAPCVKHDGFFEEEEIRFLYMRGMLGIFGSAYSDEVIQAVGVGPDQKRFFVMPLKEFPDHGFDFRPQTLLKKVIVGPADGKTQTAEIVQRLLMASNLNHVPIQVCDIPLR